MIFTTRMVYLTAVSLAEHSDAVAGALLKLGLMHFVSISDIASDDEDVLRQGLVEGDGGVNAGDRSGEARKRIETILAAGGFGRPTVGGDAIAVVPETELTAAVDLADRVGAEIDRTREKQRTIQQQINRLEDLLRHLPVGGAGLPRDVSGIGSGGSFLEITTGWVPRDRQESLEQKLSLFPAVLTPLSGRGDRLYFILVAMKRNGTEIREILDAHGYIEEQLSAETGTETREAVGERLESLRSDQRALADSIPTFVSSRRQELETFWRKMRVRELLATIHGSFAHTKRVVVVSGWLPQSEKQRVESALGGVTQGHVHIEWHEDREFSRGGAKPTHDDRAHPPRRSVVIPSRLQNPHFLSPFETLVTNFGTPAYGTIDPTGLVAVAYLIMFGLMFGDVGHGFVLLLAGVVARIWMRRRGDSGNSGGLVAALPLLSRLMLWCGSSAIVAGALFGSYFGFSWLPPLWFDYHGVVAGHVEAGPVESIFDVLTLTIYFGVVIIGLGLLINWINLIRQRRWFPLLFDKSGVLGGTTYGAGVIAAAQFASSGFRTIPNNPVIIACIVGPALVLFFKGPLEGHSRNPLWWMMEWVIELLEVFSGYLANTLSFMRVAGLGIAHVTLMIAFFQIARMASPVGMNIAGIVILIIGNVVVIVLEGLSAGIQSLRLNYYEFFSKHFQPSGVPYKPVSLEVS